MISVHSSAIVDPKAQLDEGVEVGAFSVIGPNVKIGKNTKIASHALLDGHLEIGESNQFFPFCAIGTAPQDTTYKGEPTKVEIGNSNIFREYVSIHRGTTKQDGLTCVGNSGYFMAHAHIGHDVSVGSNVVIVNSVNLAGHVVVHDRCIISGGSHVSQFVTVGRGAYVGGATAIDKDIPPFCTAYGNRVKMKGINIVGLRRLGHNRTFISEVIDFFRQMENSTLSPRAFVEVQETMNEFTKNDVVQEMATFISGSKVGVAPFLN